MKYAAQRKMQKNSNRSFLEVVPEDARLEITKLLLESLSDLVKYVADGEIPKGGMGVLILVLRPYLENIIVRKLQSNCWPGSKKNSFCFMKSIIFIHLTRIRVNIGDAR